MAANENKENDLIVDADLGSGLPFPQTPAHLLKRSVSTVFKRLDEQDKLDLSHPVCDAPGKNVSPLRKACQQQGRLPLASKDNNRGGNFALHQASQPFKRDNSLYKKRKPFERAPLGPNEQLLANPRRLKKYGSVLGYNGLPKMKSLVLKDVGQSDEQDDEEEEEEDDDEDDDRLLRSKLRDALNRSDGAKEVGGLFGKTGGLQRLIRDSKKVEEDEEDREIEYGPPKHQPLPYVPDGHIPLVQDDVEKLKTFRSPYLIEDECSRSSEETESGFLDLEHFESSEEDEGMPDRNTYSETPHTQPLLRHDILELEPRYAGEGLSTNELNDLVVE